MTLNLTDAACELIRHQPSLAREIVRQMKPKVIGGMTRRQREALAFIRSYSAEHGVSPSYDEIMWELKLASKSGVARLVEGLEQRGHIDRLPGKARSIQLRGVA